MEIANPVTLVLTQIETKDSAKMFTVVQDKSRSPVDQLLPAMLAQIEPEPKRTVQCVLLMNVMMITDHISTLTVDASNVEPIQ
jgi:hypothetical protein